MATEQELLEEEVLDDLFDDEAKPGKGKLIVTLVASAILGVAGGTFVLPSFLSGSSPTEQEETPATPSAPEQPVANHAPEPEPQEPAAHAPPQAVGRLMSISNLVVNARGTEGSRLVVATVAIELADNHELEELREREILLRDEISTILESIPMTVLIRVGARDTVKARVAQMLTRYLDGHTPRVYVPQFVLQ